MAADNNPTKARKPSEGLPVLAICLASLWVISEGIHVAGLGYCLGAPRKDAAQGLALTALVAAAAGLPLACTGGALALTGSGGAAGLVLLIVGLVLVSGAKVLYLVFLRALGLAMEVLAVARQVF